MLSVAVLFIVLNFIMLRVAMLSFIMPNVIMLSVAWPIKAVPSSATFLGLVTSFTLLSYIIVLTQSYVV